MTEKFSFGGRILAVLFFSLWLGLFAFAQQGGEVLTNNEVILMTRAGLSEDLILRKIGDSAADYDTSAAGLIELKKAGVSDAVIALMMEKKRLPETRIKPFSDSTDADPTGPPTPGPAALRSFSTTSRVVLDPQEAASRARTIAIKKSSLHPARQALEKELLKRKEWKDLNLTIVRYKEEADLLIEIGYVSLSWITHRYSYRIYDNRSGTVIAAGETTSWGSLAENLARGIAKRLKKSLNK